MAPNITTTWTNETTPTLSSCTWTDSKRPREYWIYLLDDRCINKYNAAYGLKINEMGDQTTTWTEE